LYGSMLLPSVQRVLLWCTRWRIEWNGLIFMARFTSLSGWTSSLRE
jgi:hypothetical protein